MAKLFIVGTPIGNLSDITLRALDTLRDVKYIACEDQRFTSKLIYHFELGKKTFLPHHKFNEKNSTHGVLKLLDQGNDIALVSDSGMPVVSDPGFLLIREVKKTDHEIEIIPGVSAVTYAFLASNFESHFTFLGFLTPKKIALANKLKSLSKGTYIIFVSPHKLKTMLEVIDQVFEGKEEIFLGKELTKKFEKFYRGTSLNVLNQIEIIKGEYTLVLKI